MPNQTIKKKIYNAAELQLDSNLVNADALLVLDRLQKNQFDAYIVGGGVRDLLLAKKPKDFDIVTDASPEQIRRIFKNKALIIGRRFKIVHITFYHDIINENGEKFIKRHVIEISTYRALSNNGVNEHGKILLDNTYGSQLTDSRRRDFTINSLYYDPIKGKIIDYHNSIKDIKAKILRMIGDVEQRLVEDPVRILRAIRLSTKLNLNLEQEIVEEIANYKYLLLNEPKGRLFEEFLKICLSGKAQECWQQIQHYQIPQGVFAILDQVVTTHNGQLYLLEVFKRTDARIEIGETVSISFILAVLLWPVLKIYWDKAKKANRNSKQLIIEAISQIRDSILYCGVSRPLFAGMREIWELQYELEHPVMRKLHNITTTSRFRQAYYLYQIRDQMGELSGALLFWWDKVYAAKIVSVDLIDELLLLNPNKRKKK